MRPVILPRWYAEVAPTLPSGRVLLSYPPPFSGIQSAMSWQAVNRMHYGQAGGGGPQGVAKRAGSAAPGFKVLSQLAFAVGRPLPTGTPDQYAEVRHALAVWQVTTVVIAGSTPAPLHQQGGDPSFAAAFMTAALGRLPRVQAGAWVWDDVQLGHLAPLRLKAGSLDSCVQLAQRRSGRTVATMRVPNCVVLKVWVAGEICRLLKGRPRPADLEESEACDGRPFAGRLGSLGGRRLREGFERT